MLQRDSFEEAFLGVVCYHLVLPIGPSDLTALSAAEAKGPPVFASAKVDARDDKTIRTLEQVGFRRICTQILLRIRLDGATGAASDACITERLDLDPMDVRAHAAQHVYGRFRQDPLIATDASIDLYEAWVRNSTGGAKRVIAITRNFISFEDCARVRWIDLVSVLDKRAGVASKLLYMVVTDARCRGLAEVKVVTDRDNVLALKTYQRAGFQPERSLAILHLLRHR